MDSHGTQLPVGPTKRSISRLKPAEVPTSSEVLDSRGAEVPETFEALQAALGAKTPSPWLEKLAAAKGLAPVVVDCLASGNAP